MQELPQQDHRKGLRMETTKMKLTGEGYIVNDLGKEMTCGNYCQLCGYHCAMFEVVDHDRGTNIALRCGSGRIFKGVDMTEFNAALDKAMAGNDVGVSADDVPGI